MSFWAATLCMLRTQSLSVIRARHICAVDRVQRECGLKSPLAGSIGHEPSAGGSCPLPAKRPQVGHRTGVPPPPPPPCISQALVQATVGVETVIIVCVI